MEGAVWDIETGCILKLGEKKEILHAMFGFTKLKTEEIKEIFGEKRIYEKLNKWP
jgi:hypothetical protein